MFSFATNVKTNLNRTIATKRFFTKRKFSFTIVPVKIAILSVAVRRTDESFTTGTNLEVVHHILFTTSDC